MGALGLDCIEYEEDIVHRNLRTDILSNRDISYLRQFKNVSFCTQKGAVRLSPELPPCPGSEEARTR